MTDLNRSKKKAIVLQGEVVELFNDGKETTVKIKFKEFIYEIKAPKIHELHLGDKVNLESLINLDSLKESFNHKT